MIEHEITAGEVLDALVEIAGSDLDLFREMVDRAWAAAERTPLSREPEALRSRERRKRRAADWSKVCRTCEVEKGRDGYDDYNHVDCASCRDQGLKRCSDCGEVGGVDGFTGPRCRGCHNARERRKRGPRRTMPGGPMAPPNTDHRLAQPHGRECSVCMANPRDWPKTVCVDCGSQGLKRCVACGEVKRADADFSPGRSVCKTCFVLENRLRVAAANPEHPYHTGIRATLDAGFSYRDYIVGLTSWGQAHPDQTPTPEDLVGWMLLIDGG